MVSFLGESKQGGYMNDTTQYQFNCPSCADEKGYVDGKYNLECDFSRLIFHCWSCGFSGSFSRLIKKYGGRSLLKEYFELVNYLKSSALYEFADVEKHFGARERLKLPQTFTKIKISSCRDKRLKEYLAKRNINQKIINKFNIGYTTWDEEDKNWSNRIIIPSYDEFGNLNYFIGRDFLPEKEDSTFKRIKYKNCDADKKEIVFQESLIDFDSDIYLCEGGLDCVFMSNALSLLGKTLPKDCKTYEAIVERANAKVVVCLDNDTKEEETLKICRMLNDTRLSGRIWYVRMDEYKDFGDAYEKNGAKGAISCIRTMQKYDKDRDF